MPSVVLVTCRDLPEGDEDAPALNRSLAARGIDSCWRIWNEPTDWEPAGSAPVTTPLTVVRSTWDYTADREAFLAWSRSVPRLANGPSMFEWNSDKTYLADLAAAGLPVVPTVFCPPGEPVELPASGEFVVKPSVGAGSKGAARFGEHDLAAASAHAAALQQAGRTVMVQPYLAAVDDSGETALIHVGGEYSHAIEKGAMLPPGTVNRLDPGFSGSLFVAERIQPRTAGQAEQELGRAAVDYIAGRFGTPLYARVDVLPGVDGPVIIELELVEPSLFLTYAPGAAERFAAAIAEQA